MSKQKSIIGESAPELQTKKWMQTSETGNPISLQQLRGQIVVIEVFQVNCPGCFVHALPEIVRLYNTYHKRGVSFIGLATAFEDFDKNTEANLKLLLDKGELIGEPLRQLGAAGLLDDGKLDFTLDFPVAVDKLDKTEVDTSVQTVQAFIYSQLPEFDTMPDEDKAIITHKAHSYLASRTHIPQTFSQYQLQGTPSSIVIDQLGIIRDIRLGPANHIEPLIQQLLEG